MIWLAGILGFYVLGMVAIAWFSLHPIRIPVFFAPASVDIPQEDVEFESDGIRLRGWWLPAPEARSTMVLAHGYLMNRSELSPVAVLLQRRGVNCLIFDFRAHGKSRGRKSTLGLLEAHDVKAAVAFARQKAPGTKIGLIGSSMGAAASALACGADPGLADVLVLDSAYGRMSSAIIGWWRFLGGPTLAAILTPTAVIAAPLAGFNPFKVDVSEAIAKAGPVPILILHGDRDNLALPAEAERNLAACAGPKEIVWFAGMGHSEGRWEQPEKYRDALFAFLDRHDF